MRDSLPSWLIEELAEAERRRQQKLDDERPRIEAPKYEENDNDR